MQRQTMEVYKGRAATRTFPAYDIPPGATVQLRAWKIADEPIDPTTGPFAVSENLAHADGAEEIAVVFTVVNTTALTVADLYRFRVEAVNGSEKTPIIGGRLYVGDTYGQ